MREHELISLHYALWDASPDLAHISFRGEIFPIQREDNSAQKFSSVTIGECRVISQNTRKLSRWTTWVNNHENGKITWVIKNGTFVGQVLSWKSQGQEHVRVLKLNPEMVLFEGVKHLVAS